MKVSYKIEKTKNEESGLITWSLKDEDWGPIVSGFHEEELKDKFNKAMKVALIFKTFISVNDMLSKHQFNESVLEKSVKENKGFTLQEC